jgi:LCP family protein required for cell wall assembly
MTDLRRGLLAGTMAVVVVACSTSTPTPSPTPVVSSPAASGIAVTPTTAATIPGATAPTTTPAPGKTPKPGKSTPPATPEPSATPEPTTEASATPTEPAPSGSPIAGLDQLVGTDGRFTMLILGSDARPGLGGERTDTIMIATIDPATGKTSFISLPRDTADVPIGPGRTYSPKVNGLFQQYQIDGESRKAAYDSLVKALEYTFGIEIDRYALAHFDSVINLIDQIGGIDVNLAQPFDDPTSHITKNGLHLHAGVNHLDGHFALAFARSRHTTSDYDRSRRQQLIITIAVTKVLGMGIGELATLAPSAFGAIDTNLTIGDAPALFGLAQIARFGNYKSVVLGPRTYATETAGFTNHLKVGVVRALFKRIFTS